MLTGKRSILHYTLLLAQWLLILLSGMLSLVKPSWCRCIKGAHWIMATAVRILIQVHRVRRARALISSFRLNAIMHTTRAQQRVFRVCLATLHYLLEKEFVR